MSEINEWHYLEVEDRLTVIMNNLETYVADHRVLVEKHQEIRDVVDGIVDSLNVVRDCLEKERQNYD